MADLPPKSYAAKDLAAGLARAQAWATALSAYVSDLTNPVVKSPTSQSR